MHILTKYCYPLYKKEEFCMKKIGQIVKPYISIVLGALLFLYYLNFLRFRGAALAIGIIATILAAYYLVAGILGALMGEKLGKAKGALDIISVVAFPLFWFTYLLIAIINNADTLGPTGWVIIIFGMIASLGLGVLFIVSRFSKNGLLNRLTLLFAGLFALTLGLCIIFQLDGTPVLLGDIDIIMVVIFMAYSNILFASLIRVKGAPEPVVEEVNEEEDAPEEKVEE